MTVAAVAMLLVSGCSTAVLQPSGGPAIGSDCPRGLEDLHDPALRQRIGSDFVAGTAIVHRYVDSPDPAYRGYDISITSRIAGLAEAEQVMFVAALSPLPNIELGAEVLVVGRRGPRVAEIQSGAGCPVFLPSGP